MSENCACTSLTTYGRSLPKEKRQEVFKIFNRDSILIRLVIKNFKTSQDFEVEIEFLWKNIHIKFNLDY